MKKSILNKSIAVIATLLIFSGISSAQTVVSTAGGHETIGSLKLNYTIGDAIVSTSDDEKENDINRFRVALGFHKSNVLLIPTGGLENLPGDVVVKPYPNPASDYLFINFENNTYNKVQVLLHDVEGDIVAKENIDTNFSNRAEMEIKRIPSGVYFLNILSDKGQDLGEYKVIKLDSK